MCEYLMICGCYSILRCCVICDMCYGFVGYVMCRLCYDFVGYVIYCGICDICCGFVGRVVPDIVVTLVVVVLN